MQLPDNIFTRDAAFSVVLPNRFKGIKYLKSKFLSSPYTKKMRKNSAFSYDFWTFVILLH